MTSARERIKGSIPALITPMKDGKVDETAFRKFVSWQIEQGSQGLVPCGTTGESPTLSHEEHMRVVELCVEEAAGRVPVIAGAGSNSTEEAIALTRHAKDVGADAVLSVTGYYNKPSQEGQYRHFKAIAEAVDIPILLYNIPGRAIVEINVETMARLAQIPGIIGVKDATGNLARPTRERNACGKGWRLLSGNDDVALGYMAHGGHGCISVTANVAPKLCAEFQDACMRGNYDRARELQDKLMPLHDAMFCEPSPAPAKFGASLLGHCTPDVRLPLVELTDAGRARVRDAMRGVGFNHV
jgi:4-hydroxy-tetrahydrodipicolinate synthase